jgi:cyanophycin synthetase
MFAVLEGQTENAELVLYDAGQRMPLLPAKNMPVSMGGIVHYNIANALHAAAAAYLLGVDTDTLVQGLSSFQAGDGLNPGRFNVYDHLPYKVIIDYAHNPDGLTQLASVVDRMEVSGQKVITVSAAAYQDEQTIRENALAVAGHFDHYYCFNYVRDFEAGRVAIAPQIAQALREAGVPVSQITEVDTDVVGTREAMARAREGDLLVLLTGRLSRDIVYGLVTGASDKQA